MSQNLEEILSSPFWKNPHYIRPNTTTFGNTRRILDSNEELKNNLTLRVKNYVKISQKKNEKIKSSNINNNDEYSYAQNYSSNNNDGNNDPEILKITHSSSSLPHSSSIPHSSSSTPISKVLLESTVSCNKRYHVTKERIKVNSLINKKLTDPSSSTYNPNVDLLSTKENKKEISLSFRPSNFSSTLNNTYSNNVYDPSNIAPTSSFNSSLSSSIPSSQDVVLLTRPSTSASYFLPKQDDGKKRDYLKSTREISLNDFRESLLPGPGTYTPSISNKFHKTALPLLPVREENRTRGRPRLDPKDLKIKRESEIYWQNSVNGLSDNVQYDPKYTQVKKNSKKFTIGLKRPINYIDTSIPGPGYYRDDRTYEIGKPIPITKGKNKI